MARDAIYFSRTKHIALRFFIRELVKDGKITLHFVPTGKMLADCGTKHLAKVHFKHIMDQIMFCSGQDADVVFLKQFQARPFLATEQASAQLLQPAQVGTLLKNAHPSATTKITMDTSMESEHSLHDRRRALSCSNVRDMSSEGREVAVFIGDHP